MSATPTSTTPPVVPATTSPTANYKTPSTFMVAFLVTLFSKKVSGASSTNSARTSGLRSNLILFTVPFPGMDIRSLAIKGISYSLEASVSTKKNSKTDAFTPIFHSTAHKKISGKFLILQGISLKHAKTMPHAYSESSFSSLEVSTKMRKSSRI